MPYYGHIYYGYGDFLANNLYVLLLIPVLLLSLWAQFQVSGSFRRYNAVNNRRRITGAQAAEAVLRAHGVFGVPVRPCRGNLTDHYDPRDNTIYLSETVYDAPTIAAVGVAAHEAGHAVATYYCETQDKVHEISIIPRGMAGGYTMSLPEEDRSYETRKGMQENIVTLLGGRIAEKLVLDDISTGASNDLERATKIARAMVTRYGFSDRLGPIVYGQNENEVFLGRDLGHTRDYSETVAAQIDEEIRSVIDSAYDQCEATLTEHMDQLHKVAEFLYEFEKINGADFDRLMKGDMSVFEEHRAKAGGKTTPMNPVEQPEQIASNDRQLPDDSSAETAADEAQDGADRPEPAAKPEANFPSDQSQTDDEQGPAQQ